uniref:PD-(D/E)XK nuclease superfamily protein n=1 Tax=viral metagenome TaxID=1070528 RepID=A0A6M3J459_9ZZZZ
MKVKEDPQFRQWLLHAIEVREFKERTGTHCSDLIYCLNKAALRRINPLPTSDESILLYSLGWATQRWLTGQDADEPEAEVDGIIVTMDALKEGCPWELKCTFQSSNRPIVENMHWIRQIMAQCKVAESTVAYLSRLEVMGDWGSVFPKGSSPEEKKINKALSKKPTLSTHKLEFIEQEIERNWQWLVGRKVAFEGILTTKELLPQREAVPAGQSWECGYCPYEGISEGCPYGQS